MVGDFRRLRREAVETLFPKIAHWRKPAALVRKILIRPGFYGLLLESDERICAVNPTYWRLATLFVPDAETYLSGDTDPIYVQRGDSLRMVIMPLRMADEERARILAEMGSPAVAAQPGSGADGEPGT
jgi:hypothetical protein